jgi:hypothetical protein
MITNWGKQRVSLWLVGSSSTYPSYLMIGSGSGTIFATQTELIYPSDRQAITSADGETSYKAKWIGDWNSIELSGLDPINGFHFTEWGMCIDEVGLTGSIWSRSAMPNAVTFAGLTELRIQETWEVY